MKLLPKNGFIVVRLKDGQETTTKGGIIVPDGVTNETMFMRATVVAVGEGQWNQVLGRTDPVNVSVGDEVMYFGNATQIRVDGLKYAMIHQTDISAIVDMEGSWAKEVDGNA